MVKLSGQHPAAFRFAFGSLAVMHGQNEAAALRDAFDSVCLRSPHGAVQALCALADPLLAAAEIFTFAEDGPRVQGTSSWRAALVKTQDTLFLTHTPAHAAEAVAALIQRHIQPTTPSHIVLCTEAATTAPVLSAWKSLTGRSAQPSVQLDYFLRHEGLMDAVPAPSADGTLRRATLRDIPTLFAVEYAPESASSEICTSDLLKSAVKYYESDLPHRPRYLWADAKGQLRAVLRTTLVGDTGAILCGYEAFGPSGRHPDIGKAEAVSHLTALTQAIHAEGRWLGLTTSPDHASGQALGQAVQDLGFEKVGAYHYTVLPCSTRGPMTRKNQALGFS